MPALFHWQAGDFGPPFTLALLDGGYRELISIDGIAGTCWPADARVAGCLSSGGTFHWFVAATRDGVPCRSPLASFQIR